MSTELTKNALDKLLQNINIKDVKVSTLNTWIKEEPQIANFAPEDFCAVDPRDGAPVMFNSKRAVRPHDNKTIAFDKKKPSGKFCPICKGETTGIVDMAPLSKGFTFINKNLFPCFYVKKEMNKSPMIPIAGVNTKSRSDAPDGGHYLQWTSSQHDKDWHNMPTDDLVTVLKRMAELEKKLLLDNDTNTVDSSDWHEGTQTKGFLSIIKNYGAQVGGSLEHGHQQITISNIMSPAAYNNYNFKTQHGISFSKYMQKNNPKQLLIKNYDNASLQVPYFMRRPYVTMLFLKNTTKQFLFQLNDLEYSDMAKGISNITQTYHSLLPSIGKAVAYNVLFHSGPGAGIYVEFLPYTQETGGLEQLGMWICQSTPEIAATNLISKKYIK